jgi:hypothetical protein
VFNSLRQYDILSTPNPFGYQSTGGARTYPGSPPHPKFKDFPEINGGVFAYRRCEKTRQLLIRALELIPHFASLGFDQDQAMMRHALFESTIMAAATNNNPLKEMKGLMNVYCRHGWKCDLNSCKKGCAIIHQRRCVNNGISTRLTDVNSTCAVRLESSAAKAFSFSVWNARLKKRNKGLQKRGKS